MPAGKVLSCGLQAGAAWHGWLMAAIGACRTQPRRYLWY